MNKFELTSQALNDKYAYGVFESESFKDQSITEHLKKYVIGSKFEKHPEASGEEDDPKEWHIYWVKIPSVKLQETLKIISNGLYDGWNSLIWDSNKIYVVLRHDIGELTNTSSTIIPSFDDKEIKSIKSIANKHDIDGDKIGEYIKEGIKNFKKKFYKD
jgi:hypothetical protein